MGAPTFAYKVEGITIDREGTLVFKEKPDTEELEALISYLRMKGLIGDVEEASQTMGPEAVSPLEDSGTEETQKAVPGVLTISMPKEPFTDSSLENLRKIVDSKRKLLMKALEADSLEIQVTDNSVAFPWFKDPEGDPIAVSAYTHFVSAICKMAKEAKGVTATEKETESEKYTFRCFLLRLGFVGSEFKHERAFLMKNLSGCAAFKTQAEAEAFYEKLKAKKAAAKAGPPTLG